MVTEGARQDSYTGGLYMSGHSCLYRRPSGVYAVRIVVPKRLLDLVGRGEIHTTTGLRDWNAAKLAALKS